MSDKIEGLIGSTDMSADPTEFLKSLANGDLSIDADLGSDEDSEDYDFDEDSTPIGVEDTSDRDNITDGYSNLFGPSGDSDDDDKSDNAFNNIKKKKLKNRSRLKFLNEFGTNLTEKASQGKIDRIIGRDTEIERCIQILNRRTKNNPVLIGAPGVGKTAVAQGLAVKIIEGSVPEAS